MLKRLVSLFLTITAFSACGSSDNNTAQINSDTPVKKVVPIDSIRHSVVFPPEMSSPRQSAFDEYFVRIGDRNYYCGYKGKCEESDTMGGKRSFLFDLKAEYLIDRVFLYPTGAANYFVVWQETNHTGVYSNVALFEKGNSKPKWKKRFSDPDPGQIAVDSSVAYVTTLGMVCKMDIASGEVVWMKDSLFDPLKSRFKKFDKPIVYTNTVCFFDFPIRGRKNKRDTIKVNDQTGNFVR